MRRPLTLPMGSVYFALLALFLYIPIIILTLFSFNNAVLLIFPFRGFTLRWYRELLRAEELLKAVGNSLVIGVASSAVSTLLGAMGAVGISRFRFPGRRAFLAVASLPLVIPYVVLGVALLLLFGMIGIPL